MLSSDTKIALEYQNKRKSIGIAYFLFFFLGIFGIHHLYLGHYIKWLYNIAVMGLCIALLKNHQIAGAIICFIVWGLISFLILWAQVGRANKRILKNLIKKEENSI